MVIWLPIDMPYSGAEGVRLDAELLNALEAQRRVRDGRRGRAARFCIIAPSSM
jgi:hypothetical protein